MRKQQRNDEAPIIAYGYVSNLAIDHGHQCAMFREVFKD